MRFLPPLLLACLIAALILPANNLSAEQELIVHEWGTITSQHEKDGTIVGRLNRIAPDEVLPEFVHSYEPPKQSDESPTFAKSPATSGHPDVIMRLETPVIYFHLPEGMASPDPFSVEVDFQGGLINEFYPTATASAALDNERIAGKIADGVLEGWDGLSLNNYVRGTLKWDDIVLTNSPSPPDTESRVWTAPRKTSSLGVQLPGGESEKYLFYRGVAHLDALLQTRVANQQITLLAPDSLHWMEQPAISIPHVWIVRILSPEVAAFKELHDLRISRDAESDELASLPTFKRNEFRAENPGNLLKLKKNMKEALVSGGLFEDEADAMLATWETSYFGTPGLRIFYMVPEQWIEHYLPMEISIPAVKTRVLIGRIDIVEE